MKRRYALHPMEFAIGETEQFYSEMAAKGWFLEKRGGWFSRFRRGEPAAMRYRVELADLRFLDPDHGLPEEQISVYEECGWKYVTGHGLFHIFSSPADSDAPEFYTDPRQQALVLRGLRRSYVSSWILLIVIFAVNTLFYFSFGSRTFGNGWGSWYQVFVSDTGIVLTLAAMLFWGLFSLLYGNIRIGQLYRRLRKGIPMDHTPRRRNWFYKGIRLMSACAVAYSLTVMGFQYLGAYRGDMPAVSDGPYLNLEELGVEGERHSYFTNGPSGLRYEKGLLSENWYTNEQVYQPEKEDIVWLYQDVYRLRRPQMADSFVESLMWDSAWSSSPADYTRLNDSRFDGIWTARNEMIVQSGDTVWVFTYYELETAFSREDLLQAVAERQSK